MFDLWLKFSVENILFEIYTRVVLLFARKCWKCKFKWTHNFHISWRKNIYNSWRKWSDFICRTTLNQRREVTVWKYLSNNWLSLIRICNSHPKDCSNLLNDSLDLIWTLYLLQLTTCGSSQALIINLHAFI